MPYLLVCGREDDHDDEMERCLGFDNDIQCSYSSLSTTTTITLEGR